MQTQDKHPAHVRSARQRCDETWNSASIRLWQNVSLSQKGNLAGTLSTHSLQVESIFPAAQNEEKVNVTSLCFLCSDVKMDVFWSK